MHNASDLRERAEAIAAAKLACRDALRAHAQKLRHYAQRAAELRLAITDVVVYCLNVDSAGAVELSDRLCPGARAEWRSMAARGEAVWTIGLAYRARIVADVGAVDVGVSGKLRAMASDIPVLVADRGVFEVFCAREVPTR